MKKIIKDIRHYTSLFLVFAVGLGAFLSLSYNRFFQILIVIFMAIAYVVWGVVHHKMHKDYDLSVLVEYLVMAILGLVIVFSLIIRA